MSGTWLPGIDYSKRHDLVYLYMLYSLITLFSDYISVPPPGRRGGIRDRSGGYQVVHIGCQLCLILSGLGMADVITIPGV